MDKRPYSEVATQLDSVEDSPLVQSLDDFALMIVGGGIGDTVL
jgi:hypothetical protein